MMFLHFLDLPQPPSTHLLISLEVVFFLFYLKYRISASELVARILIRERAGYLIVV